MKDGGVETERGRVVSKALGRVYFGLEVLLSSQRCNVDGERHTWPACTLPPTSPTPRCENLPSRLTLRALHGFKAADSASALCFCFCLLLTKPPGRGDVCSPKEGPLAVSVVSRVCHHPACRLPSDVCTCTVLSQCSGQTLGRQGPHVAAAAICNTTPLHGRLPHPTRC